MSLLGKTLRTHGSSPIQKKSAGPRTPDVRISSDRRASPPVGGLVTSLVFPQRLLLAGCVVVSAALNPAAQSASRENGSNELDAFMEKVLARREVNRQTLKQYILDEQEEFEILGPGRWPLHRSNRDFTWYMRDGIHVRSPLKFNGVTVDREERDRY